MPDVKRPPAGNQQAQALGQQGVGGPQQRQACTQECCGQGKLVCEGGQPVEPGSRRTPQKRVVCRQPPPQINKVSSSRCHRRRRRERRAGLPGCCCLHNTPSTTCMSSRRDATRHATKSASAPRSFTCLRAAGETRNQQGDLWGRCLLPLLPPLAGGRCRWRRPHLRNGSSAQLLITCLHRLLWDIKSLFLGADAGRRSCMWLRRAPAACTRVEPRRRRGGAGLPTVRCNCCGSLGRAAGLHLWGMTGRGECRRASRARDGRSLSIERYAR